MEALDIETDSLMLNKVNAVNSLLKPLKLLVCQSSSGWQIMTQRGWSIAMFIDYDGMCMFAETHLPGMAGLDAIIEIVKLTEKWAFGECAQWNGYVNTENPYYGCRSLEEMQIRCDLLGA